MTSIGRNIALWTLLPLFAAGGYYAIEFAGDGDGAEQYLTEAVASGPISQTVSANGTLNPVSLVNVGTQVSGTVRRLHVDFNDRVQPGQLLLELDDSVLSAQAKQSEANVKNAEAALELTHANEERMRALFAKEYVSRQELDESLKARKSAQAQLELAHAQLEKDRANLGYTRIRSPVEGVVVDRVVDVGQTVAASFQTPVLIKIARDLAKMQIDTSFAEADIGSIRVGQVAKFNVDAFHDRGFEGSVKQIRLNPTTQQNVVTYDVVISVDNPELVLLPGMTAYVKIAVADRAEALLVPNAALRFRPGGSERDRRAGPAQGGGGMKAKGKEGRRKEGFTGTVYVLEGGRLAARELTLGITDSRSTEVIAGDLKPGDRVVTGRAAGKGNEAPTGVNLRMF